MNNVSLAPDQLIAQLQWRYATKKFDATKKIPDDLWNTLEQSLILAPSSFGLQPWKFFVVRSSNLRQQLVEHAWGQSQVVDASHLVVLAIKKDVSAEDVDHYIERMAEVRQTSVESLERLADTVKGFLNQPPYPLDINAWSTRQVYIALAFLMASAALLGIDTCPMEGFIPAKFNEILGLSEMGYSAVVLCPVGYRAEDDKYADMPKVRFAKEDLIQYLD
ncbi:MAG TPA: NAD(P)H-dependent oxidoreductase [Trichocoleus sp.]